MSQARPDLATKLYLPEHGAGWTLQSFSLRLCTESLHRDFDHFGFEDVGPILPCPPGEVLTRKEARLALGLDQDALIVWHQTTKSKTPGHYQEILESRSEELGYQLLQISPGSDLSQRAIPPARYLRAANLFVGQSGHQSYYEVVQAGVPAAFFPVDIPNDNQFQRAKGTYGPTHPQIHTPSLNEFSNTLPQLLKADLQPIHPFRGAQTAAQKILDLLDQGD